MNQQRMKSEQMPVFREIPNPYVPGPPLRPGSSLFFGQEEVFDFIRTSLSGPTRNFALVLTGQRRAGKTSLALQMPARLDRNLYVVVYIDGQALGIEPGINLFLRDLSMGICDGLEDYGIECKPLSLEASERSATEEFERGFLQQVFCAIGERSLVIVFDEFEELENRVQAGSLPLDVFSYLRHLMQHVGQLSFVFVGTRSLEELGGEYWSVLFNVALHRRITFLSQEATVHLVTTPVAPYGVKYDDAALDEILHFTNGHPYFTQLLCSCLVSRANRSQYASITVDDVRGAATEMLEMADAHLTYLWQSSGREGRVIMSALAEVKEQSDQVTVAAIAAYLGERQLYLDVRQITAVTRRLIDHDILQSHPNNPPTLDFTVQLYAHWLRKYKSFSLALKEAILDEEWQRATNSIEESLFTTGSVTPDQLASIAEPDRQYAWSRYLDTYRSEFGFVEAPFLQFKNQQGLTSLNEAWQRMVSTVMPQGAIEDAFDGGAGGVLEQIQLVGFKKLALESLPKHPTLLTFLLDTRLAFEGVKLPLSVPLIFVRRLEIGEEDVLELRHLLHEQMSPPCNLALIVVPGNAAPHQRTEDLLREKLKPYACDVVLLGLKELQRLIVALNPSTMLRHVVLSKINLISISPFVTTGATSDNIFFGREPELREIGQHIVAMSYAIVGGRRIGKSSLLGCLHRVRLPAAGFCTIYYDCSPTPTYEAFLTAAIRDWRPELPPDVPATFGDLLQSPPTEKPLVLLLDEADKLVPTDYAGGWRLFTALRALASSGHVQVVLSGERTLRNALRDPKSPLFNFANEMLLGPLDFRAVEELVTRPMKQLEIELVDEKAIVGRIWTFTSGHPNVVQRLCRRLIERLNEQGTRRITLGDVNVIIKDPGFQRDDFLSTYWEAATALEKIISLLMADDDGVRTLSTVRSALTKRCGLHPQAREVDDALQRLVDLRSILKRTPTGYEFAVTAFPRVVAGTMTLDDMLEVWVEDYTGEQAKGEA